MNNFTIICRYLKSQGMFTIEMVEHYLENPHLMDLTKSMLYPSVQRKIKEFIELNMQLDRRVDVVSIVQCIGFRPDIVVDNLTYLIRNGEVRREINGLGGCYKLNLSHILT